MRSVDWQGNNPRDPVVGENRNALPVEIHLGVSAFADGKSVIFGVHSGEKRWYRGH